MASNKKVITLGLDYSQFDGGITEVNRKMGLLDAQFKLVSEQTKNFGTTTDQLTLKQSYLTQKINLQTQAVKETKEKYDKALESGKASDKQLDNLHKRYINSQIALEKLNNSLSENEQAMKGVADSSEVAGKGLDSTSSSSVDLASKLYLVQEALQYVKKALNDYVEFDVSMAKVNSIADTTAVSFKQLKQGVYEIAKQTGQSANTISNALYETISANVSTKDALLVTEKAAKLAKAGFTDAATAVDTLTTIMNAYKLSAEEAGIISDKLIMTQNLGKATVGELGESFGKVAGLAKEAGISIDEVLAATATLTLTNGSASESLTSLKSAISNIIKPTAEARELAKQLGIQFNATALEGLGLSGFLDLVQRKTKGNTETMAKLFGSVEALNSMLQLTGSGAESFADYLDQISKAGGTTDEALEKMDSTGNNFKDSLANLGTTLLQVGDTLSPLLNVLSVVFDVLSRIPTPIYIIMIAIGVLAIVIKNITAIKAAYAAITTVCSAVMGIFSTTAGTTAASLIPLLIVIGAIVAVIGLLIGGVKSVSAAFKETTSGVSEMVSEVSGAQRSMEASVTNQTTNQRKYTMRHVGNASGTDNFEGGETWINEGGPELVELPRGSRIHNAENTKRMIGGDTYITNMYVRADEIDEVQKVIRIVKSQQQSYRRGVQPT